MLALENHWKREYGFDCTGRGWRYGSWKLVVCPRASLSFLEADDDNNDSNDYMLSKVSTISMQTKMVATLNPRDMDAARYTQKSAGMTGNFMWSSGACHLCARCSAMSSSWDDQVVRSSDYLDGKKKKVLLFAVSLVFSYIYLVITI